MSASTGDFSPNPSGYFVSSLYRIVHCSNFTTLLPYGGWWVWTTMNLELFDRLEVAANLSGNGRCYAGMGAGNTPASICVVLSDIAAALFKRGWMLRSGGSIGADLAFEQGAEDRKEIFFPKDATVEAHLVAQRYCPDWNRRTSFAKNLLARKSMILLGAKLDSPVSALICWTADGRPSGGTGQAIRVAVGHGIPVYNLFDAQARAIFSRSELAACSTRF